MDAPTPVIAEIFAQAEAYAEKSDVYNAVKLYKKLLKLAPDWALPWARLANVYKGRGEWKPCMQYTKNAASLNPSQLIML
jgi:predicted TPR repeat methyltransferase